MIKFLSILIVTFSLVGCASYNSSFECKANSGVGCKSVSTVYGMVDKGELPVKPNTIAEQKVKKQTIKAKNKLPFPQVIPDNLHAFEVFRKPESVLRIWLAPFVSKDGAYQEAQYIHEVVDPSSWLEDKG